MSDPVLQAIRDERALVGLCVALGASDVGGALSAAELALIAEAPAVDDDVVAAARQAITGGGDPLGELFAALRPPAARRELGAFYTPRALVEAMVGWVLERSPARVVDAGCGSGRYALTVRHRGFSGDLVAVDLDPLATLMTRAASAVTGIDITVRCESFLTLELEAKVGATAWLGNPPYVRHHRLGRDVKTWAKEVGDRLGVHVSGLAGLHALFFLKVAADGGAGDIGCFVTSSEWMEAAYGALVRELLAGDLGLVRLDTVARDVAAFDDAATTACIASFATGYRGPALVETITDPATMEALGGGQEVARERLTSTSRWSELDKPVRSRPTGMVELGELVSVRRGLATGANKFFVLPATRATELGLESVAVPIVAKAEEVLSCHGTLSAEHLTKVLLDIPVEIGDEVVAAYVAAGEAAGTHLGYLCAHRTPWWHVEGGGAPAVLATYMGRQPTMFALNGAGARNLNTVHGLWPRTPLRPAVLAVLVAWLNEHRFELVGGRVYQGGLLKVEPRDMQGFLVPSLERLEELAGE